MNEQVNIELLPSTLLKHEDRVVMLTNRWMILDGINRHGEQLRENNLLSVLYSSYGYWVSLRCSKEMYENDNNFFWEFIRQRVATKLCLLRKETDKE